MSLLCDWCPYWGLDVVDSVTGLWAFQCQITLLDSASHLHYIIIKLVFLKSHCLSFCFRLVISHIFFHLTVFLLLFASHNLHHLQILNKIRNSSWILCIFLICFIFIIISIISVYIVVESNVSYWFRWNILHLWNLLP